MANTDLQACVICGTPTTMGRTLRKCGVCGHAFRPFDGDATRFHIEEFRQRHQRVAHEVDADGRVTTAFHEARRELVRARRERIEGFLKPRFSALDVGGGAGTFAAAISDLVDSIRLIEVDPNLVQGARELGVTAEVATLDEFRSPLPFDVVFAWHVLEHIEDARAAASRLRSLFTEFLVVEVPVQRRVPTNFDGHFHYFCDESLQRLFPDLVLAEYGSGLQPPSRLAVFTKPAVQRRIGRRLVMAADEPDRARGAAIST